MSTARSPLCLGRLLRFGRAALAVPLCLAGLGAGAGAHRALALELVGGTPTPLTITVSHGQMLRLDAPAASVFIADPAIADVQVMSPRMVYLFGRQPGETNLMALGEQDRVIANVRLTVQPNLDRLGEVIGRVAPGAAVGAAPVEGALMLDGTVESASEAADIARAAAAVTGSPQSVINRLGVRGPNQINLRVRIAEVSRTAIRRLGINWDSLFSTGAPGFVFGLATGNPALIASDAGWQFNTRVNGANNLAGAFATPSVNVNAVLDALEQENLVSILAEPNLTALSGETASFLAGGEFPVPVAQQDDTLSIQFKQFGVSLAFTPTLLAGGRISMRVRPEVSQLSDIGAIRVDSLVIPALATRRAETTVELGSGQSFAIAGLFQDTLTRTRGGVIGLSDLPIIGPLFRSVDYENNLSELVIVVTPYLVQPVSDPGLTLPTDRLNATTGLPRAASPLGAVPGRGGSGPVPAGVGVNGPAGFILR